MAAALAIASSLLGLYASIAAVSPMNGEDYALAKPLDTASMGVIEWTWHRSSYQIAHWNARFGEQLAIFWLAVGKPALVVANTAAFAVFCAITTWYARATMALDRAFGFAALFASTLAFLAWPRLEIFFWETTAAGYLQPLVLTLAALLPFFATQAREWLVSSRLALAVFASAAWLAGASFENVPASAGLAMVLATFAARRATPSGWTRLSMVAGSYLLGWLMLVVAPSTAHRVRFYGQVVGADHSSAFAWMLRVGRAGVTFGETTGVFILVVIGLIALACLLGHRVATCIPKEHALLLLTTAPSVVVVALAPYAEPRAFAWFWIVLLIVATRACHLIHRRYPGGAEAAVLVLSVVAVIYATRVRAEYAQLARDVARRDAFIRSAKASGACARAVPISLISTDASPRVLNNRESWVGASLDQVSRYYGCLLTLR